MKSLAYQLDRYRRNECRRSNNRKTPGRCKAATIYVNKANKFIKEKINESVKNTESGEIDLYNDRVKSYRSNKRDIYPIVNHDFDYKTAVMKNTNVYKLGITNQPTVSNLFKVPFKLKKYLDTIVNDPYPNNRTIAGRDDILEEDVKLSNIKNSYRMMDKKLPYPSFKKDYPECRFPTKGKHSSSYFVRSGTCKTKIDNENECRRKEYTWYENKPKFPKIFKQMAKTSKSKKPVGKLKGSCYKPRYIYIDNSAKGLFGKKGLHPSLFNDLMSITPDKLFQILAGNSVEGGGILPCTEDFINYNSKTKEFSAKENFHLNLIIFLVLSLMIYIIFIRK